MTTATETTTELAPVIVGPARMPFTDRDRNRRPVASRWPIYAYRPTPQGDCGPKLGELWLNPRTGLRTVYLFGGGVRLDAYRPTDEQALAARGLRAVRSH